MVRNRISNYVKMHYCLIFLLTRFLTAFSQDTLILTDSSKKISWSPKSDQSVIIQANEGYKIAVNVTDCNINSANGEYVTISPGGVNSTGVLFTYSLSSKPSYLYNTNTLYAEFRGTNNSNFTTIFARVGEELTTTTTEPPTTSIVLPTPSVNDSDQIRVIIAGRAAHDYDQELQNTFRTAVAAMATEYCDDNHFSLNESITIANVILHELVACGVDWLNHETCVKITFAVPVNLNKEIDSPWTGYQLTSDHLEMMWYRLADKYLPNGLTNYDSPDVDTWFSWQIGIFSAVIVLFIIGLVAIRYSAIKVSTRLRRRKLSDAASIISRNDRTSQVSLPQHYLQETPALFENAYPMYNPKLGTTYSDTPYRHPYSMFEDCSLGNDNSGFSDDEENTKESGA